jgi:hypothetical protein
MCPGRAILVPTFIFLPIQTVPPFQTPQPWDPQRPYTSHHNPEDHTATSPTPCSLRPIEVCGWPDITVSHRTSINICHPNHHNQGQDNDHLSSCLLRCMANWFMLHLRILSADRIAKAEKDHADGSFDIRYCMDGSVEKNVNRLRITSYNPLVTTARRTNGTDVARPSILAPSHQPQQRSSPLSQPPTPPASPRGIQHIIIQSRGWSEHDRHPNPLLVHLRDGRSKPRAWLRIGEGEYNKYEKGTKKGVMKSQLSE